MSKYIIMALLAVSLFVPQLDAGEAGSTGAVFLKLPTGSRPIAMGENFIAVADDSNAIYWNPAGMCQLENGELMFMHSTYFATIMYDYVAAAFPIGKFMAAGVAFNIITMDDLDTYSGALDAFGNPIKGDSFGVKLGTGYAAFSYKLTPRLLTGLSLKYIFQRVSGNDIGSYSSNSFAADLGVIYRVWRRLSAAMVVQNLGVDAKFSGENLEDSSGDPLPLMVKFGVSYGIENGVLAMDGTWPVDNKITIGLGGEYWYRQLLAVRVGYKYQGAVDMNDLGSDLTGLYLGGGLHKKLGAADLGVDYAYNDKGMLGVLHRVTLVVGF